METDARLRVWIVSELYYPEETSTGRFVTGIAESLAAEYDVRVLCSQPTYFRRGVLAPRREERRGTHIERVWSTRLDKNTLGGKVLNMLTFVGSIFVRLVLALRSGDFVFVVTNPPLLPYVAALAAIPHRTRVVLLVHDVYPEVLTATQMIERGSFPEEALRASSRWLYHRMTRIVAIGRDMAAVLLRTAPDLAARIVMIPNWADADEVVPVPREQSRLLAKENLADRFVVQYFGNMGRTHAMESLVDAARILSGEDADVHFLFIGDGARKRAVEQLISQHALTNCAVLPSCDETELCDYLSACDIGVITLLPGMAGVSVPSRMYNILAAGKPIIAAVEESSEVAHVVREENVGWVIPPNNARALVNAIAIAKTASRERREMSLRAREAAESTYAAPRIQARYRELFRELTSFAVYSPSMKSERPRA